MKIKRLSDYLSLINSALDKTSDKKNWIKAKHYGEIALRKLPRLVQTPSEKYSLYIILGDAYSHLAEYSRSLDAYYKSHLIATKHHLKPTDIAYASLMIMNNLLNLRYLKQAFVQFKKVEQYFQKYGAKTSPMDEQRYATTYLSIGSYYLFQKELKKVQEILEEKLLPYQSYFSKGPPLIKYQQLKSEYMIAIKDYTQATHSCQIGIRESKKINAHRGVFQAKINLSVIALLKNQLDTAIEILEDVLKDACFYKHNDFICAAGIILNKYYLIKGMPNNAKRVGTRIKPFLNRLDAVWLYEINREVEEILQQIQTIYETASVCTPDLLTKTANRYYETSPYKNIIGKSAAMQEIYRLLAKIAPTDLPVLIQGETGTGKELVANAIHQNSTRDNKEFLAFDCNVIPETLIESHLFGHSKDAYTGANGNKRGYIELTSGGTLFVDEIANMPPAMQTKLLRVLEEQIVRPLGAEKSIPVNTRFIFASNQNIEELVKSKIFRQDLFYRINTITINLPPLRKRKEDIPLLVRHFLKECAAQTAMRPKQPLKKISDSTLDIMLNYFWPGNVRELKNEIKRICVLQPSAKLIDESMLAESIRNYKAVMPVPVKQNLTLKQSLDTHERATIEAALKNCEYNIIRAARQLGCNKVRLYRKIKSLKITFKSPS